MKSLNEEYLEKNYEIKVKRKDKNDNIRASTDNTYIFDEQKFKIFARRSKDT
jgi:hypothetical protein